MSAGCLHSEFVAEDSFALATVSQSGLSVRVLPNGSIYSIESEGIQINQVLASPVAGGIGRITLRILERDGVKLVPVAGPGFRGELRHHADRFVWVGVCDELSFQATLHLADDGRGWLTKIDITNLTNKPLRVDAIQIQDIALATRGQARNNELFTSQYLDHRVFDSPEFGPVIATRQNLPQPQGRHPWLIQACLPRAAGALVDGIDSIGTAFRGGDVPACFRRRAIGRLARQGEMAWPTLQSETLDIAPTQTAAITFASRYEPHHPAASDAADLRRLDHIRAMHTNLVQTPPPDAGRSVSWTSGIFDNAELSSGRAPTANELRDLFGKDWQHVESTGDRIDSFFLADATHIVTRSKLDAVARPHGQIYRAGTGNSPDDELLSLATYAHGQFGAQVTVGNSSLAKFLSPMRDPLNVMRSGGLRIFIADDPSNWRQLGVPSVFAMRLDGCRWVYLLDNDTIEIDLALDAGEPVARYSLSSRRAIRWLVCGEVACDGAEFDQPARASFDADAGTISLRPARSTLIARKQPGISLEIAVDSPPLIDRIGGDEVLFDRSSSRGLPYAVVRTKPTSKFDFAFRGTLGTTPAESRNAASHRADLVGVTQFESASSPHADLLNTSLAWLAHDARIHMSVTRGLEQYNGGAWGVRDVCQGPVEFLLAFDRPADVAAILRRVFSHQYRRRGDWPQWFMLEPYQMIQSPHCHGDVVIWPVKALCDYLEFTDDAAILDEQLPYANDETFEVGEPAEALIEHVDRAIDRMTAAFLPDTHLPRFGDGDWDDSLQPADATLRDRMVSSWTTALMFQTLERYAGALERFGQTKRAAKLRRITAGIRDDFNRHLVIDGVVAGFVVFENDSPRRRDVMLHPLDSRTGLHHRLIPMTRSILAGLFTPPQAKHHLELIRQHLLAPDGARLMDRPTRYAGGVETIFRRSESAAFFGREIGLQYVHAHLRYAEALAKLGEREALWQALRVVNPVCVTDAVPNARPRQRNAYFSSSDAEFLDRADAIERYGELRDGRVGVTGGWRVYSSGPGIYANLVTRHLLGLRWHYDKFVIDPILPAELSGLVCTISLGGKATRVRFEPGATGAVKVNGRSIATEAFTTPYRRNGVAVDRAAFLKSLDKPANEISIGMAG